VFEVGDAGREKALGYLRDGDVFGEMSLLKKQPRSATVEAVTEARLYRLQPQGFVDLHERFPEFRHAIEERIASYDHAAVARVPLDFAIEMIPAEVVDGKSLPVAAGMMGEARIRSGESTFLGRFLQPFRQLEQNAPVAGQK
jgi:signal-transduction protein with cAMP-binding, CBS, and nucleotidyltransferase domain